MRATRTRTDATTAMLRGIIRRLDALSRAIAPPDHHYKSRGVPAAAAAATVALGEAMRSISIPAGSAISIRVSANGETAVETSDFLLAKRRGAIPEHANRFRIRGEAWDITFAGETACFGDSKGLRYLRFLLASPGVSVPASMLAAAWSSGVVTADAALATAAEGLRAGELDSGPMLDTAGLRRCRARLKEIEAELSDPTSPMTAEAKEALRLEREGILCEIRKSFGRGGRPRRLGDSGERSRKAVSGAIDDALNRIERHLPALARHLRDSIKKGRSLRYAPAERVEWEI